MNLNDIKITKIETVVPDDIMGNIVLLRIHTNKGIIGHGESYYTPHAVASTIHDWMSRRLLDQNPLNIESHWRFLFERTSSFGGRGTELRALSAIDLALWDILGQYCGVPIWQLLGGKSRDEVPLYNSSGGKTYGASKGQDKQGWPGHGSKGQPGELEDYWAVINQPEEYAKELIKEGYTGLKTWLFDEYARKPGGTLRISNSDLKKALEPIKRIRDAVGDQIEIMVDGHGFFQLPAAIRIADALKEYNIFWAEDILRMDNLDTLKVFSQKTSIPLAISEMCSTIEDYRKVLEMGIADYIEIDPTWAGGISESMKITHLAQTYNIPVTYHDCTGPLTLYAGVQMAVANTNVVYQESVRAHIRVIYNSLIDNNLVIKNGFIAAPEQPGIGTAFLPSLFEGNKYQYRASCV